MTEESTKVEKRAPSDSQPKKGSPRKQLKSLIKGAISGDTEKIKALLKPFLTNEEELISWGLSGKMGMIPTYNFYFLTDRRVGDFEITPLTGNLQVETAFLQRINAVVMRQPAILLLRINMVLLYVVAVVLGLWPTIFSAVAGQVPISMLFSVWNLTKVVVLVALVKWVINPAAKRVYLRFRKSGMYVKLIGTGAGSLIFADRTRFSALAALARQITQYKRELDKEAR